MVSLDDRYGDEVTVTVIVWFAQPVSRPSRWSWWTSAGRWTQRRHGNWRPTIFANQRRSAGRPGGLETIAARTSAGTSADGPGGLRKRPRPHIRRSAAASGPARGVVHSRIACLSRRPPSSCRSRSGPAVGYAAASSRRLGAERRPSRTGSRQDPGTAVRWRSRDLREERNNIVMSINNI